MWNEIRVKDPVSLVGIIERRSWSRSCWGWDEEFSWRYCRSLECWFHSRQVARISGGLESQFVGLW